MPLSKPRTVLAAAVFFLAAAAATASAQGLPKPEDVLGFKVGDDYHLATYTQAINYLKRLAAGSDRIKLMDMGKTSMGQTMTYAVISLPRNLASLEKHKDISRRLALARLAPAEARRLAQEGRAVVYIDGGLHASECAPAQHNIQLAYELAAAQDDKTLRILNDVILVLVFANPDGMNLLAD
ncbi:MAG: peptidase, partial [Candidatus Aminicenantes bacterium]|nr:peptidase [Candidatus Aminicenantes bacterium]